MGRAGFSLVEVAVATLIIVLLLGIAVSLGSGAGARQSLEEAARQLVHDIRRTQELAIARNIPVSLAIAADVAGGQGYRILEGNAGVPVTDLPLPGGVTFDPGEIGRKIGFDPLGGVASSTDLRIAAAAPRPFIIDLVGRDGSTRRIEVMAGTGLARSP